MQQAKLVRQVARGWRPPTPAWLGSSPLKHCQCFGQILVTIARMSSLIIICPAGSSLNRALKHCIYHAVGAFGLSRFTNTIRGGLRSSSRPPSCIAALRILSKRFPRSKECSSKRGHGTNLEILTGRPGIKALWIHRWSAILGTAVLQASNATVVLDN